MDHERVGKCENVENMEVFDDDPSELWPHVCVQCGAEFTEEDDLNKHMSTHYINSDDDSGDGDQVLDSHSYTNSESDISAKEILCTDCGKGFGTADDLEIHSYVHNRVACHVCLQCEAVFTSPVHLQKHVVAMHTTQKPHTCEICQKGFNLQDNLIAHIRTHNYEASGPTKYKCTQCEEEFSTLTKLRKHILTHTDKNTRACAICSESFNTAAELKRHLISHTAVKLPKHVCPTCGKSRKTEQALKFHMACHLGKHMCLQCGKTFTKNYHLRTHRKTHTTKPHRCVYCGESFRHFSALITHTTTHTDDKPQVCAECGQRYASDTALAQHVKQFHPDPIDTNLTRQTEIATPYQSEPINIRSKPPEGPHRCTICGEAFAKRSLLLKHTVEQNHQEKKPHPCPHCDKAFISNRLMRKHIWVHGDPNKPHKCIYCGNGYATPSRLRAHTLTHTGEKPFACTLCPKSFRHRWVLNSHSATCHQGTPSVGVTSTSGVNVAGGNFIPRVSKEGGVKIEAPSIPDQAESSKTSSGSYLHGDNDSCSQEMKSKPETIESLFPTPIKIFTERGTVKNTAQVLTSDELRKRMFSNLTVSAKKTGGDELSVLPDFERRNAQRILTVPKDDPDEAKIAVALLRSDSCRGNPLKPNPRSEIRRISDVTESITMSTVLENEGAITHTVKISRVPPALLRSVNPLSILKIRPNAVDKKLVPPSLRTGSVSLLSPQACLASSKVGNNSVTAPQVSATSMKAANICVTSPQESLSSKVSKTCVPSPQDVLRHERDQPLSQKPSASPSMSAHTSNNETKSEAVKRHSECNDSISPVKTAPVHPQHIVSACQSESINISTSSKEPLACSICGAVYKMPSKLRKHVLSHADVDLAPGVAQVLAAINPSVSASKVKRYSCPQCDDEFKEESLFKAHLLTHFHVCTTCSDTFASRSLLAKHMHTHEEKKSHPCLYCDKTFRYVGAMQKHSRVHGDPNANKPYKCKMCDKRYSKRSNLRIHTYSHTGEKPFSCKRCPRSFNQQWLLNIHSTTHGKEEVPSAGSASGPDVPGKLGEESQPSPVCLSRDKTHRESIPAMLDIEINVHKNDATHTVNIPNVPPTVRKSVKLQSIHIRPESVKQKLSPPPSETGNSDLLQTPGCLSASKVGNDSIIVPLEATSSKVPNNCIILPRGSTSSNVANISVTLPKDVSRDDAKKPCVVKFQYACPTCGKLFINQQKLDDHKSLHAESELHHCCSKCHRKFLEKTELEDHFSSMHRPQPYAWSCLVCGQGFLWREALRKHSRTHPEYPHLPDMGVKTHPCSECDKSYIEKGDLNRHVRIVHNEEKPHLCETCGRGFGRATDLKSHMYTHTEKVPYTDKNSRLIACSDCEETFPNMYRLRAHRYSHTGEWPHACSKCDKRYTEKSQLTRHFISVHTNERPHVCDVCGRGFVLPGSLRQHKLTHTPGRPHMCQHCRRCFKTVKVLKGHLEIVHADLSMVNADNTDNAAISNAIDNAAASNTIDNAATCNTIDNAAVSNTDD